MSASTKLSTAVKAVCYLAESHPEPKTSGQISEVTGVNASKLRKILSMLVKQGIVLSSSGMQGGFTVGKDPAKLDIQEIYCALEDRKAFYLDVNKNSTHPDGFSNKLNFFFLDLFADIQVDIEEKMKRITIKSILENINK